MNAGSAPNPKAVGNHEMKALYGAMLFSEPETAFTITQMHEAMQSHIGSAWPDLHLFTGIQFCDRSFEPNDYTEHTITLNSQGRPARAHQVTALGVAQGLAEAGASLHWSDEFPLYSVQELIGRSAGRPQSQHTRLDIFRSMAALGFEATVRELSEHSKAPRVAAEIGRIMDSPTSVVTMETSQRIYDPTLVITNADYTGSRPFDHLKPETQVIYRVLGELAAAGISEVQCSTIVDKVLEQHPASIGAYVKKRVLQGISRSDNITALPGVALAPDGRGVLGDEASVVLIRQEARLAVRTLVETFDNLANNDAAHMYRETARELLDDPVAAHTLALKAKRFSPSYRAKIATKPVEEHVLDVVREEPTPVSMHTVTTAFRQMGLQQQKPYIATILKRLMDEGLIAVTEQNFDGAGRIHNHATCYKSVSTELATSE